MPIYNLVETMHNKWLQQSDNKISRLYEATMDEMPTFLTLKATVICIDPKLLAGAMTSYLGSKDLNTKDCALEGLKLFLAQNKNSTCHSLPIVTHIDLTKWTTTILAQTLGQKEHA